MKDAHERSSGSILPETLANAGERVIDAVRAMRKNRAHAALQSVIYAIEGHSLTAVQVDILESVAAGSAMRMSDVAAALGVDASTLTRTIQPLFEFGLLRRRVSSDDRRAVIVEVTEAGETGVRQVAETRRAVMRAVLSRMQPERIQLLAELMEEYLASVTVEAEASGLR